MPLTFPKERSVQFLYDCIKFASERFKITEFTLREVVDSRPATSSADRYIEWDVAYDVLAREGKIEEISASEKRFRMTDKFPVPPQFVAVTVPPSMAALLERHREDAVGMAEAYTQQYLVENGLRDLIALALRYKAADWWGLVPPHIQDSAKASFDRGLKKPRYSTPKTWDQLTPAEKLTYTTFPQLRVIVEEQWSAFEGLLPDGWRRSTFTAKILELEPLRDDIGHVRPLSLEDRNRLESQARDIADGLQRAGKSTTRSG